MLKQKIKLMTDSVSDISKDRAETLGIRMLYMPITVEGKALREEIDFTKEEFYQMIDSAKEYPSTAQITPFEILEAYEQTAAEGYTDLIYVTIGAGGSGTYANASMAREQFYEAHPVSEDRLKIHLVDGRNYTATYGYAVTEAAKKLARGASVPELIDYLEDWTSHAGLYFVPMTLPDLQLQIQRDSEDPRRAEHHSENGRGRQGGYAAAFAVYRDAGCRYRDRKGIRRGTDQGARLSAGRLLEHRCGDLLQCRPPCVRLCHQAQGSGHGVNSTPETNG